MHISFKIKESLLISFSVRLLMQYNEIIKNVCKPFNLSPLQRGEWGLCYPLQTYLESSILHIMESIVACMHLVASKSIIQILFTLRAFRGFCDN